MHKLPRRRRAKWPSQSGRISEDNYPTDNGLGVSYTYVSGDAKAGPIGPADWPVIRMLERDGKLSFTNEKIPRPLLEAARARARSLMWFGLAHPTRLIGMAGNCHNTRSCAARDRP